MDIQRLIEMDDVEFAQCVSQTVKRRADFPEWWRALLHPDVIDATQEEIERNIVVGERQARDPGRYPFAAGFVAKMRGVLAEITMARVTGEG